MMMRPEAQRPVVHGTREGNITEEPMMADRDGDWRRELVRMWPGELQWDYPLARLTTLRVGGPAAAVAFPANSPELQALIGWLTSHGVAWRLIGRGSNILAADQGFAGVVIVLDRRFSAIKLLAAGSDQQLIRVEAGCGLGRLVGWGLRHGLAGLEFLAGIPGSVGGALVMNAGAWQQEISDLVQAIEVLDPTGRLRVVERERLRFHYRRLELSEGEVVVAGILRLQPGERRAQTAACRRVLAERRRMQPLAAPSAGSFFRNPPGREPAGWLIERAGLKGLRVGEAVVSERHANFLVNLGQATARDFLELMRQVQERVHAWSGVWLEPEVHFLGEPWEKTAPRPEGEGGEG